MPNHHAQLKASDMSMFLKIGTQYISLQASEFQVAKEYN